MLKLNESYSHQGFLDFLNEFLPDFEKDERKGNFESLKAVETATYLGKSKKLNLQVFELTHKVTSGARITLTTDGFRIMKQSASFRALVVFYSKDAGDWRLSLMTLTPEPNEKGKATVQYSNPRRYSFFLGPKAKINTPTRFLISKGQALDFDDLKNRFSIEVVNKEFYKEISQAFTALVNGQLKLPSTEDKSQTHLEFAVRMIGRIIFCWFLREKYSEAGVSLMPKDLLSLEATKSKSDYYHNVLEPIFFEILNKPIKSRKEDFTKEPYSLIPYLNGGLFSPQEDDYYKRGTYQSDFYNTLTIPDEWFKDFFEILETYNFTIDENTSYDEELSIDPEMLGRIFENLLAEINPETGESARKSTGSYYTPRVIVNYMVDESLLLYLKDQTCISEEKLKAVISYDLSDDPTNPTSENEKEMIIDALEKVKILDPACGSGAFPMGALQKIVFILQQTDPDGQIWFKKQIKNTSPEVRRVVEREFEHKNFDYIRKLGIIRENIYGVDIQAIATEISRLRCFLTLIVDQGIQDGIENRGIEPLPNLDFKFVTANSLIGLPKIDVNQQELFDNNLKIEELKSLRDQYFTAKNDERKDLMLAFSDSQSEMINDLIDKHSFTGVIKADLTRKLTDWKPFKHKSTEWFDPEWMFGIKDGFDIVIANPPWVFSRKGNFDVSDKKYFAENYIGAKGKINLFSLFLNKGYMLNKKNGVMTMIMPNTFLRGSVYEKLRRFILENTSIFAIVDTGTDVFGGITASTMVLITQKSEPSDDISTYLVDSTLSFIKSGTIKTNSVLKSKSAILNIGISVVENALKSKIDMISIPLNFYVRNIISGIQTWKQNKKDFIKNTKENEQFKPLIEGKDIGRYFTFYKGKYIFYSKSVLNVMQDENIFVAPEKIVIQRISGGSSPIRATIDRNSYYCFNSLNTLICKGVSNSFILAVLNSKVTNWYYSRYFSNNSNLTVNLSTGLLKQLPVPKFNESQESSIVKVVEKILKITNSEGYLESTENQEMVKDYEEQIDQMIYKLYDLTPKEIEIIENG